MLTDDLVRQLDDPKQTDNRFESYRVDNPLHRFNPNAPDQDLGRLMLAGPAASTRPTVSQPNP